MPSATEPRSPTLSTLASRTRRLLAIGVAGVVGLPLVAGGIAALVLGGAPPWLAAAGATLGGFVLVVAAAFAGWTLAPGAEPSQPTARQPPDSLSPSSPTLIVFGCAQPPTVSWVDRLIELPRDTRRAMALRVPGGARGARWLADLLSTVESHAGTLERLVLVVDAARYPTPVRAALDRLVRSHIDTPRGTVPARHVAIEHLVLDDPDDPEPIVATVAAKLAELARFSTTPKRIAVAPGSGDVTLTMALTLAATAYPCELLYFSPSRDLDAGPARFELRHP